MATWWKVPAGRTCQVDVDVSTGHPGEVSDWAVSRLVDHGIIGFCGCEDPAAGSSERQWRLRIDAQDFSNTANGTERFYHVRSRDYQLNDTNLCVLFCGTLLAQRCFTRV